MCKHRREITFAVGESRKTFNINIVENIHFFGDKVAVLEIKDVTEYVNTKTVVTIADATRTSVVGFENEVLSVDESGGTTNVKVIREGNSLVEVSVGVRLNNTKSTATNLDDYNLSSLGTITLKVVKLKKIFY